MTSCAKSPVRLLPLDVAVVVAVVCPLPAKTIFHYIYIFSLNFHIFAFAEAGNGMVGRAAGEVGGAATECISHLPCEPFVFHFMVIRFVAPLPPCASSHTHRRADTVHSVHCGALKC